MSKSSNWESTIKPTKSVALLSNLFYNKQKEVTYL